MREFKIRAYGLQELAMCYFPYSNPNSASVQLKRWMMNDKLFIKLVAAGYRHGQRILTPKQVSIIIEHLGNP